MTASDIVIAAAQFPEETDAVRQLFVDYRAWLGIDLEFQGFTKELASLPGKYAAPQGAVLLARDGDAIAGGVALWRLEDGICEMKRLFVRPDWREQGLGRRLVDGIIGAGRRAGYRRMRLDSESRLTSALNLYASYGFREIAAYYANPLPNIVYLELDLMGETQNHEQL